MTCEEIQKAFDFEYIIEKNMRHFTRDSQTEKNWEDDLYVTRKSDDEYHCEIETYDDTRYKTMNAEELAAMVNDGGWELQERTADQIADSELAAAPDTDEPDVCYKPDTYTTKSGYTMNVYFIDMGAAPRTGYYDHNRILDTVKELRGWFDKKRNGFVMRSERDARRVVDMIVEAGENEERDRQRRTFGRGY